MPEMPTEQFIRWLAADAKPLRPLRSPLMRAAVWLACALPWVVAVVWIMGPRADLRARMTDPRWLIEEGAAFATAVSAAAAAFCAGVPGRARWESLMPLLPLAVWLGALGQGCVHDWLQLGPAGLALRSDWLCLPGVVLVGAGPAVAITVMILRGSPIAPATTTALAALAAGGLAGAALPLFHREDASIMVLVWQAGTVLGLAGLAGVAGRKILHWHRCVASIAGMERSGP
jgi:hypothetical protein